MLRDEEFRAGIYDALEELTKDIEPSERLTRYVSELGGSPSPQKRRLLLGHGIRRRWLALPAAAVAALVAVAIVLLGSTATTPSFAVTKGPDDSISVTIRDLTGVSGANQRLREYGAPIRVVPIQDGCTSHIDLTYLKVAQQPATISLTLNTIQPGYTAVIAARMTGSNTAEMALGRVTGAVPSCVAPEPSGYEVPIQRPGGQMPSQDSGGGAGD
jgi:hypothetical protein